MKLRFMNVFSVVAVVIIMAASATSCVILPTETATTPTISAREPFGKYEPAINITFTRCIDDDLVANVLPKCPGESIGDNRWTRMYKEQFGINIKYAWTVNGGYSSDAYTQKMNVTLATGDIPDVVIVNASQLKQLADADMITDMTWYFNDYSTDLLKSIYTKGGSATLDSATFGGKLMAIPLQDDATEAVQYLWLRADWLKKLNLQAPKTMDDLLKISEAFTTQDPDGNGQNDTYGLAITKDLYSGCMGTEGFFAGYHAYPNIWIKDSTGKLVYGSIQPETRNALQKLAEMYKAGQIDQEFGIKNACKAAETIAAGKIGINFGEQWNPMYPLISNFNNDNNADWTGYSIVSADSQPVKIPLKFRISVYYAVKNGYEHPEAVVKLLNLYADINCGERSINEYNKYFVPAENGNVGVWKFSPVSINPPLTNYNIFLSIDDARQTKDTSRLNPAAKPVLANIEAYRNGDKAQWSWDRIYGVTGVFHVMKEYQANHSLLPEEFAGALTKTMGERKSTLEKMEIETFVKIIMGAASVDEFAKFARDWNKLGGEMITREVNEWYNSVNTK